MEPARVHRSDEILTEIAGKGDFPATARAITRLRTVAPREDTNMLALAGVILQDAGLSTKVLRVVNSAFYRPRDARVSTISRAILLLGFDSIRDLATGILLIDSLFKHGGSNALLRDNLRRALHTALLAQALAERVRHSSREEAYLLGLFARLGHLWLAAHYGESYDAAVALADFEKGAALDEAVRHVVGVRPRELAAAILEHWDLPDTYVEHFHRAPTPDDVRAAGPARLHAVVDAAQAHTASATPGSPPSPAWLARCEKTLGLSADTLADVLERVDREALEQVSALGLSAAADEGKSPQAAAHGGHGSPGASASSVQRNGAGGAKSSDASVVALSPASAARATSGESKPVEVVHGDSTPAPAGDGLAPCYADLALATEIAAEISRAIVEREPLANVLSAVLEGVARSGRFDAAVLALATTAQDALRSRLSVGAGEDLASLSVPLVREGGMLAETALTRAPRIVESGTAALLVPAGVAVPRQEIGSFLTVPLLIRDRLLGVLLAARAPSSPGVAPRDVAVVQLFGQLACVACTAHQV
jgi:HD-like signal output (HDOD) protein/GAF domain-containing protein